MDVQSTKGVLRIPLRSLRLDFDLLSRRIPEWIALLIVLILAAGMRFGWMGVNSYAGDEARISLDALRLTRGGQFVFVAQPSSTGVPFFPASVWIFAPPYLLSPDPWIATLYVCAISLLVVVGVWRLARPLGRLPAFTAGLFMAASPYAVLYGRSIWQPNLLPAFGLLWMASASIALTAHGRRRSIAVGVTAFLSFFALQVHFAGAALLLAGVLLALRGRWWRSGLRRSALAGAGLAVVPALPYVYYVTVVDPSAISGVRSAGGLSVDFIGLEHLIRLALGYGWGYLALGEADRYGERVIPALLAGLVLIVGGRWLVRVLVRGQPFKQRALAEVNVMLLLAVPLFFVIHATPVLPHYLLTALPAAALLAGWAAAGGRALRLVATAGVIAAAVIWSFSVAASLNQAAAERPPQSAISSILAESRQVAEAVPPDTPVIFHAHGDDPALSGEVAVFQTLLWGHPAGARVVNGETILVLPPHRAVIAASLEPFQAWEEWLAAGLAAADETRLLPRRTPAESFVMGMYDGVRMPQGFTAAEPVLLANGAQIEGWRARWVGERLRISTLWHMTGDPPAGTFQQFHHLYPANAETPPLDQPPPIGVDVPLGLRTWRAGDRVIVMADLFDLPAGAYHVVVGQYTLPDLARIPRADGTDGRIILTPPLDTGEL